MKNKGFLLVDAIVSVFIFIVIILNLLVILNKNFENMKKIVLNEEKLRLINNIQNILQRDFSEKKEEKLYYILNSDNKLILKNLKNNREEELGKFKYISKENIKEIRIKGKDIILNNKNLGKIYFSFIEIDDKNIENIIEE